MIARGRSSTYPPMNRTVDGWATGRTSVASVQVGIRRSDRRQYTDVDVIHFRHHSVPLFPFFGLISTTITDGRLSEYAVHASMSTPVTNTDVPFFTHAGHPRQGIGRFWSSSLSNLDDLPSPPSSFVRRCRRPSGNSTGISSSRSSSSFRFSHIITRWCSTARSWTTYST